MISERGLSAYHRDADNVASGSARDSSDAASASASVPPSGTDSLGFPSPSRGDNALFGVPDSHPSSSSRFASAYDNLPQSRWLITADLSFVITWRHRFNLATAFNNCG